MKEIKTSSGAVYYYNPKDNTIQATLDDSKYDFSTEYYLNERYDFNHISMFTIEVTQRCNLRCRYCCYSGDYENRREHSDLDISYDYADKVVSFIAEHMDKDAKDISVCFYGGEALLAREKIKYIITNLINVSPQTKFDFTISSNGTTLSKSVLLWINTIPNLKITITIDGSKDMHDKNRVNSYGKGSYELIMKNLLWYKENYKDQFDRRIQFIATVESIEAIINLNEYWMNNAIVSSKRPLHISSIIPNTNKGAKVKYSGKAFQNVFDIALDYYKNHDENLLTDELKKIIGPVNYRFYGDLPKVQRLTTCINNPYSCFISSDGSIYACERFCQQFSLGNIINGIDLSKCKEINNKYYLRKRKFCSSCWAQRLCRKCATILNYDEKTSESYCENEKMRISLALKYFCELKEYKTFENFK